MTDNTKTEQNPRGGGSWLRDPVTGELTPNDPPADRAPHPAADPTPAPAPASKKTVKE